MKTDAESRVDTQPTGEQGAQPRPATDAVSTTSTVESACMPEPFCRCCVCQGIHCLMPHPGHSHHDAPVTPLELMQQRMMQRAAVIRRSPVLMALERLQDMLMKVQWVRMASGAKYACAFCGGVSDRDGGPGHADDCEWVEQTSRDLVAEFQGWSPSVGEAPSPESAASLSANHSVVPGAETK